MYKQGLIDGTIRKVVLVLISLGSTILTFSQCINTFPHTQDFESGAAGWTSGIYEGTSNTWALGEPNKSIISGACGGSNAWTTGGLTDLYAPGEHSYVQSPCYDFSGITNPMLSVCIWIETEGGYDGTVLQASVGGGAWEDIGGTGSTSSCEGATNWYNDASVNYLDGYGGTTGNGWNGNNGTLTGSGCTAPGGGSGGWITATHCLPGGGNSNVQFRFLFGAGTVCEAEGFAFDNFTVSDGTGVGDVTPAFNITGCSKSGSRRELTFDDTTIGGACFTDYSWDFGDGNTEVGTASPGAADTDNGYMATGTYTACLSFSNGSCNEKTYCCDVTITDGASPAQCNVLTSGCGILLSSKFIQLLGKVDGGTNKLIINLNEPSSVSKIIVEKSDDNKEFYVLKEFSPNEVNLYSVFDYKPNHETYYRALVYLNNGTTEKSSPLVLLNAGGNKSFHIENISPNPANNSVSFDVNITERNTSLNIRIFNVLGSEVYSETITNSGKLEINTAHLESGVYYLSLSSDSETISEKIIVQH